MKKLLAIIIIAVVLLPGCFITNFFSRMKGGLPTKQIVLQTAKDDYPLTVEIADSEEEREKGLMNRDNIEEGKGMLFVFADEAPRVFWMKNTKIPLDAIFFNGKKEVVSVIENMEPCRTPDCKSYSSKKPAMYALELRAGFIKAYDVKVGDKMIEN